MSFLAPLFLIGLGAIALPILLHLRKKRPKESMPFSSLMFLEENVPVTKTRSRLHDILLLILRCLAIALLALAFSRPFFAQKNDKDVALNGVLHYILIDTSASMRGAPLDMAIKQAKKLIENTATNDRIALATFSDTLRPLLHPDPEPPTSIREQKQNALSLLNKIKEDWYATKIDKALLAAQSSLNNNSPVVIHLISDLQKGSSINGLEGEPWRENLQIIPHPIIVNGTWTNAGVHIIPAMNRAPQVRVTNSAESEKSDFILTWGTQAGINIWVAPGETAIFNAPDGIAAEGYVSLSGDDFDYDNRSAWVIPTPPTAAVYYPQYLLKDDANESAYYINHALQSTNDYTVRIHSTLPESPPELIITHGEIDMSDLVANGGNVLFTIHDTQAGENLAKLLDVPSFPIKEADVDQTIRLGEIDYKSAHFQPFSDPRYADFSRINIWKYRTLPEDVASLGKILARFDNGDPAWIEYSRGELTINLLTTSWRPIDSQLALSTKFPPLMHSLLSQGLNNDTPSSYNYIGEHYQNPGIHTIDNTSVSTLLNPSESERTPLPLAELSALGAPTDSLIKTDRYAQANSQLSSKELEKRQRIGWYFLCAAALFFLMETIYSAFFTHRRLGTLNP